MEDIRTATVALKALVELGYPLELSSLIDYLAKSPDSRDELVKFDNEDTLSIFLKKFPSMFWVDGCKVFPAQLKPKGVSKSSNKTRPPQSHSVVQAATDLCDERRGEDQPMGEVEDPDENPKLSCSGEKKEVKLGDTKVGMLDTEGDGPKERNPSKEEVNSKKDGEASAVNQGKVGQEEDESTLNLECSAKQKTEVLNDATTVPFTSTSHTCHAQESQESQQQFPTCESTKESAYMTAMRNLFTKQRKLSIVTIVEELRAVYSEDKIDEGAAHLFLKRHPDMYQLTEDDKVEEQAPVDVMATILKVLKWNALGTLEDGSQVYIPKALYAERMGVACASMRDHLSKGDCILVDTEQGMTSRTAKWTATNIRAIFKSPNVHISNERTKKIDLHTAVPYMLATKAIRSPSELDDVILNFVITSFNKRTECTLQYLNSNMRYLNHDGLLHLRSNGGLLKFLQGHPDKFQIVHTHAVSINKEHSQICTNTSNLDAECASSDESAMETALKGTLHQEDKTSSSNPDNQATSESMVTVHRLVNAHNIHAQADSATPSIATKCVTGEIHSIEDDFILFYLQNGERALLSGLKKMQKDTTMNIHVECLSVGDCILLDVVPGPLHSETQWTVSKMKHTLKKAIPSQIQCSESTATHDNVALNEVFEQLEEQLDTVIAWLTFLTNKVRVSFKDLEACMRDLPKNVQKCTLQKTGPIQFLEQYPSLFHVDIVRSEVCLVERPRTNTACCGALLVPKSSSDQDKGVAPVQPPLEGTSVAGHVIATDSSETGVTAIDQAAVEFFRNKVSEKGKLSIHDLSSCFAVCPMAIRKHVGSSEKGLIKFFKDHADTFLLENEKVVSLLDTARAMEEAKHDHTAKETVAALSDDKRTADGKNIDEATPSPMSSSSGDSDVIEREALSGTQDVDALLKKGASHFVEVLKKKGSMPLNRIHGHVNQLREEVKKAIGSGQENVRALFLRFPAYFFIDATDAVHLAQKQQEEKEASRQIEDNKKSQASLLEEGAAHFVAVLKKKGSMPLSRINGHVCQCREEVKKAVGLGPEKARALFLRFPAYFFMDATDTVHLHVASKQQEETESSKSKQRQDDIKAEASLLEEGAAHFVAVLKKKGSLPLSKISGHVCQCREEVKQAVGGGPEKARALFLKFPAYFFIDATDTVHLASKEQEEKEASKQSQGDIKDEASLLEEGAAHFVGILEKKGSLPLSRIFGHVCKCRDEVKQAVGLSPEKARTLFLKFPAYFFIDATDTVHLASKEQEEKETSKQTEGDIKSEAALLEEGAAHFVQVLEKKGSIPLSTIHGHMFQCKTEVWKAIGGGQENARSLFLKFPSYFHIDSEENVHLTSTVTQECIKAVSAVLERKGPTHLGELVSHVGFSEPKMSSYFQRNSPKTFLEQHPKIFVIDDNMVYLVSAIKEEGVQYFKKVLELKGSLHIKNLSGHCSQYKYLGPMLEVVGGSPSSVMDFLKGFPEVFSIGDDGMVHLTSASITQSQIFKLDANKVLYLKGTSSSKQPQRWASCDTLAVPRDTAFPRVLSKLSKQVLGSTPDVRIAGGGKTLLQAEEVQDKPTQLPKKGCKDKNRTEDGMARSSPNAEQHFQDQKSGTSMSNNIYDEYAIAVKNILSKNKCLHLSELVNELSALFPHDKFDLSGLRLFLKKHPYVFHVNNKDVVEELPPVNALAIITVVQSSCCFAKLQDDSNVFMYIALYRERFGLECHRLNDHLSPGDTLIIDTEHSAPGSTNMKWAAKSIKGLFKTSLASADNQRANLQMPMPYLPATTVTRSPAELDEAIVNVLSAFLRVTSPLQFDDLSFRMRYLNHDAVLYLREKGGLMHFLQTHPQTFQLDNGNVALVVGQATSYQEYNKVTKANEKECEGSIGNQTSKAKCIIGEVSTIANDTAHLLLSDGKEAKLKLKDVQESTTTSCLSVGDCLVAYINIVPSNQSEIPWEVSEVKCVMGKAVPAQVHAKTATATCGSHLLNNVLQQCVLEEEVDTVLAWHRLLSQKTQVAFEEVEECFKGLVSKKARIHTLQQGVPCEFFEKYPTLFHVDRFKKAVSLVECSPMSKTLFDDVKHVKTPPAQVEGNTQTVTEKPPPVLGNSLASATDTDKDAVEFFKSMVLAKGQVSVQVLSTCFSACPTAIRQHVGSSMKGLAKFLCDHPDTFSLDENNMMCTLKNTFKTVKQGRETDQIAQKAVAYFKAILSKKGPSTIHVLSSGFGSCPANIRMHVGSSKVGLTNFFMDHPEIFTVDKEQVVSLTAKTSAEVDSSLPNKDGGDKLDWNYLSDGVRLVDAQEQHQHPTQIQALEVDTNDASKEKQNCDHAKGARDQSSSKRHIGSALLQEGSELSTEVQEDRNISTVEDASRSSCRQSPNPPVSHSSELQDMENQDDQENNQQEPEQKLDQAEIEKETLELIVNLVQKSRQVSLRSLQGHINLLGEEKQDCIKDKGGLLTFLQHHYGTIFEINSTSESVSLRQKQDVQRTEPDFLTSSSAEGEQLQPSQLTVEEEVEMVRSSPEKTSICVDISDAEDSKKNHNVPMKETGDDIATSVLKTRHNTEDCDDMDISTVVTPSVFVAQETDIVHTPNALLEQYLNEKKAVCDSSGLPTATVRPVVPVDNPPGQPDDDFTSLLHMFKDNLSPIQDNLVEVEMDIGRIPIARYYNPASPNLLAPLRLSEEMLTRETLETILSALPLDRSATGQGRVLLRGSLHWVSTLKNSSDDIVGLTLRRGQAVPGCLDLLWDMVTSGTSTLIIGRPCSGKTTLLREWARVLSDVCYRRVIVVDTLNEIAGGDDVPHPGVGGARRVQVHNRCQQVSQLQTAARNHSPDCIIVDEVQTLEEVTALQAIRLTGIQVIAGVCAGSLPDLLHNSVMRGLLGMSDPTSSTSAQHSANRQTPTFPHSLPVFQAAVQIHNRDNLSVYSDVASFVRMSLLEGRFPLAQHRKRVVTNGRQTEL